ncbi:MAG: hypothetical protein QG656_1363, partial [Candidatus Hydrogenedentes bacterium]|nr:hypothetical protein [Candidatus Hydrogenedentota bacterium]
MAWEYGLANNNAGGNVMSATKDFGHWFNRLLPGLVLVLSLLAAYSSAADDNKQAAHEIVIVLDTAPGEVDARVADVLKDRIQRCCGASVEVSQAKGGNLRVYLGQIGLGNAFDRLCAENGVRTPGRAKPFAEGYAVKTVSVDGVPSVIAAGADKRGTLYAAGELLRQMRFEPKGVILTGVDVSTAPAYRYRGSSANQGGTMLEKTGARGWTEAESQDYMLDLALSGANCLYAGGKAFDFVKSFDLMSVTGCRPNELNDPPKEWRGTEWGNWVCPSIPEAREALRKSWAADFPNRQAYDVMRIYAGDPGGCRCPRCTPWGKTFVELCEEAANVWLESHPGSVVQIANQDLTNDGDQAIFDYLNAQPRPWLEAIAYGPGSNAMSDYFRSELREDLFEYPGDGPVNRYLAETLNQLPKQQKIVHYSDITHWISAQYQVEHPEPNIARIYGRRTFHARPKAFYRIFKAIMPFSEGDIIYSEGYHDEFHQYLWNRLLWDPNRSLDEVVLEYCALHFGEAAAPRMRDALYQMEDNIETPLATNPGIDRYYLHVKEAGWQIPAHLMMNNHRWRLHM